MKNFQILLLRSMVVLIFLLLFSFPMRLDANPLTHYVFTIDPNTDDWPQKYNNQVDGSWCGAASLQAQIHWDWNHHHAGTVGQDHFYYQHTLWNFARDHTCKNIVAKGVQGSDSSLPGIVGNGWYEVRKLNVSRDFGLDPHAIAWMMWKYGPPDHYYHNWIYYGNTYNATVSLLWTVQHYQEPVIVAVDHGSHLILVIGYEADRPADNASGPGMIHNIQIADPLYGGPQAHQWISYSDWESRRFTRYTAPADPDPSTGGYQPPPDHWRHHWVTIERDNFMTVSPDWAYTFNTTLGRPEIIPHHYKDWQPFWGVDFPD